MPSSAPAPRWPDLLPAGRPALMGILNLTPDSFSDGGRYESPDAALAHAGRLLAAGADIIDIGGESTRPGATPVAPAGPYRSTRATPPSCARHSAPAQ